jgi:hypothetical protein
MTADELAELEEHLESARLAAKWLVNHAHRANEYDRPYAVLALEHIQDAIKTIRDRSG